VSICFSFLYHTGPLIRTLLFLLGLWQKNNDAEQLSDKGVKFSEAKAFQFQKDKKEPHVRPGNYAFRTIKKVASSSMLDVLQPSFARCRHRNSVSKQCSLTEMGKVDMFRRSYGVVSFYESVCLNTSMK